MRAFSHLSQLASGEQVGTIGHFENSPPSYQGFPGDTCPKITAFECELRKSGYLSTYQRQGVNFRQALQMLFFGELTDFVRPQRQ